jgi:cysteinyl-tRNA synthetase
VFDWVRQANSAADPSGDADLREMLDVLGLDNLLDAPEAEAPAEAVSLMAEREEARQSRDWQRADALREQLRELGWEVRDGPGGPELLPAG